MFLFFLQLILEFRLNHYFNHEFSGIDLYFLQNDNIRSPFENLLFIFR